MYVSVAKKLSLYTRSELCSIHAGLSEDETKISTTSNTPHNFRPRAAARARRGARYFNIIRQRKKESINRTGPMEVLIQELLPPWQSSEMCSCGKGGASQCIFLISTRKFRTRHTCSARKYSPGWYISQALANLSQRCTYVSSRGYRVTLPYL